MVAGVGPAETFAWIGVGGAGETERDVAEEAPWAGVLEAAWRFGGIMRRVKAGRIGEWTGAIYIEFMLSINVAVPALSALRRGVVS